MVKRLVEQEAVTFNPQHQNGKYGRACSYAELFLEATKLLSYERQPSVSVVKPVLAFRLQKLQATYSVWWTKACCESCGCWTQKAIQLRLADCDDTDLHRIASFLDPHCKELAFLPESDRHLVIEEIVHWLLSTHQVEMKGLQRLRNQLKQVWTRSGSWVSLKHF